MPGGGGGEKGTPLVSVLRIPVRIWFGSRCGFGFLFDAHSDPNWTFPCADPAF